MNTFIENTKSHKNNKGLQVNYFHCTSIVLVALALKLL